MAFRSANQIQFCQNSGFLIRCAKVIDPWLMLILKPINPSTEPMQSSFLRSITILALSVAIISCGGNQKKENETVDTPLLTELNPESTGVTFSNNVAAGNFFNYFNWEYIYNGGGVSVMDLDNNGKLDIYFTGNQVGDKIYRNLGNLTFEDVTASTINEKTDDWRTGVTYADVNADGMMDIYVCRSGPTNEPKLTSNLLFINQGDFQFVEMAEELGLADTGHSSQASFLDYDLDGDLDLYVMNYPNRFNVAISKKELETRKREGTGSTDRLYQNNNGKFTDVSDEAGIWNHAYGLGLSIGDVNNDGWPDIYISNDYDLGDQFWVNQKDGTFKDEVTFRVKHTSNSGMGTDMADFNNDGSLDIIQTDMAYSDHVRSKTNMASMSTRRFRSLVATGHHFQYMHNTLQLNVGNGVFSEIAHLAKVAKTDWSWSALFADIDLDGHKDLWITNGYKLDAKNRDSQNLIDEQYSDRSNKDYEKAVKLLPKTQIANAYYRNDGNLRFSSVSEEWGISSKLSSNGAAYADLDNDGDLDLVINNLDTSASVIENSASENQNWIGVEIQSKIGNPLGVGTRITLMSKAGNQTSEIQTTRGFQSSVDPRVLFGLGGQSKVDSIEIQWPTGKLTVIQDPQINQYHVIDGSIGSGKKKKNELKGKFADRTDAFPFRYQHKENKFDDFEHQVLLPHRQSRHGPTIATADLNGDGLGDLFIGGARGESASILLQQGNGAFQPSSSALTNMHKEYEDVGSLFFDADSDGDKDLYVVSGGISVDHDSPLLQDRLYLNDGAGNLSYDPSALPAMFTSGHSVSTSDVDGDGDLDLFVGGRVSVKNYPRHPNSYLLINQGGKFLDHTDDLAPTVSEVGMVTRSFFADVDGDSDEDLIIAGEFLSIAIFKNDGGKFSKAESNGLDNSEGWWFGLEILDLDKDGDLDIVGGNLGLNHKFKAKPEKPFNLYAGDFDQNGKIDIVLSQYQGKHNYPVRGRECSSDQMPSITQKFPTFNEFAVAEVSDIYGEGISDSLHFKVHSFASSAFINNGSGNFQRKVLPTEAQVAPIMDFEPMDINDDGIIDLLCVGNFFDTEVETTRHDASYGQVLIGNGDGTFTAMPYSESKLFAPGNARNMIQLDYTSSKIPLYIIANNSQPMQVLQLVK